MKQTIKISKWFPDLSRDIEVSAVYLKDNSLIPVAKIKPTCNMGEATCTRTSYVTVETEVEKKLPVKPAIFLERGKTLESINVLKGLQPLPISISNEKDDSEDYSAQMSM